MYGYPRPVSVTERHRQVAWTGGRTKSLVPEEVNAGGTIEIHPAESLTKEPKVDLFPECFLVGLYRSLLNRILPEIPLRQLHAGDP
jgi:hypothetical protein